MSTLQAGALVALLLLLLFSRRNHLPPGPPGNVAGEFTNAAMAEVFEKWRRKYGAHQVTPTFPVVPYHSPDHLCLGRIFSFKLGTKIVIGTVNISYFVDCTLRRHQVLNDINATTDLLDKRGEIYSSRPRFVVSYVACILLYADPLISVGTKSCLVENAVSALLMVSTGGNGAR
jgi:hypothetical protein